MARTVPQQIDIGNASSIYFSNKLESGTKKGGYIDPQLSNLIYLARQGVEWLYALSPTHADLTIMGDYLIAICPDAARAEANIIGGGSTPTVVSASRPERIEFNISSSSFIPTGGLSVTLPESWQGFNLSFDRGNVPQSILTTEPSYFTWNRNTRLFTCFPAANVGELFALIPE